MTDPDAIDPALDPAVREARRRLEATDAALSRIHRSVLALIAACGIAVFVQTGVGGDGPPNRFVVATVVTALVAVLARRFSTSPVMRLGPRIVLAGIGLTATAALALAGAALPRIGGEQVQGLGLVIGAGILALTRPSVRPPEMTPRS